MCYVAQLCVSLVLVLTTKLPENLWNGQPYCVITMPTVRTFRLLSALSNISICECLLVSLLALNWHLSSVPRKLLVKDFQVLQKRD